MYVLTVCPSNSANRRITIPEAFLTTDIILTTLQNVSISSSFAIRIR